MTWIQKLYDTYEQCARAPQFASNPPLPIGHTTAQAHIEIAIDGNGNFRRAMVMNREDQTTLIPCTEDSGGRAGQKPKNHPLCDKLQYVAGDYRSLGGDVTVGFAKDLREPFANYLQDLQEWVASESSHPKVTAVLRYVEKKQVVQNLIEEGILSLDAEGKLLKEWKGDKRDAPPIFQVIPSGASPENSFVRWRVETPGEPQSAVWEDDELVRCWIGYYKRKQSKHGLCMVTGEETILAIQHPAKIRNSGDKSKLISSNDTAGYTFRGRFVDADQACGVSFEVTQKAHNALRWLLSPERKQAFRNGNDQVVVAWSLAGDLLPDAFENSAELFGLEVERPRAGHSYDGDAGQAFAVRLKQRIAGYRAKLGSTAQIVVMALDSATPGRMAMTYYRELTGSEFLDRIESWHESHAWHQNFGKDFRFIGAPSPKEFAQAAYGRQGKSGESLSKATVDRVLPCIVDGRPVPRDIVESAVRRTANRQGLEGWEWEKNLGISCALFRGHHSKRGYQMALEEERTSRDYLFGRLLAVAEHLEGRALYLAEERRETNAAKLMQRFASHPCSTWRNIELSLLASKARLRSKSPGFLVNMEGLIDGIVNAFDGRDFTADAKLSGEFLLGYHCQRQSLRSKPESEKVDEPVENENSEGE